MNYSFTLFSENYQIQLSARVISERVKSLVIVLINFIMVTAKPSHFKIFM